MGEWTIISFEKSDKSGWVVGATHIKADTAKEAVLKARANGSIEKTARFAVIAGFHSLEERSVDAYRWDVNALED